MARFASLQDLVLRCQTQMTEHPIDKVLDPAFHPEYDLVQLKWDGWWVALQGIRDGTMDVITSGGEIRARYPIRFGSSFLLIAEWMYGTNWSQAPDRKGNFIVRDILYWKDKYQSFDCSEMDLSQRLKVLESLDPVRLPVDAQIIETYSREVVDRLWQEYSSWEGLVLKQSNALFGTQELDFKVKRSYSDDFVAMSFSKGNGRLASTLGSIQGGKYNGEGTLVLICTVGGGFTDEQRAKYWEDRDILIGTVFEASGKGKFPSGALRHPAFLRWRPDKLPERCKVK